MCPFFPLTLFSQWIFVSFLSCTKVDLFSLSLFYQVQFHENSSLSEDTSLAHTDLIYEEFNFQITMKLVFFITYNFMEILLHVKRFLSLILTLSFTGSSDYDQVGSSFFPLLFFIKYNFMEILGLSLIHI